MLGTRPTIHPAVIRMLAMLSQRQAQVSPDESEEAPAAGAFARDFRNTRLSAYSQRLQASHTHTFGREKNNDLRVSPGDQCGQESTHPMRVELADPPAPTSKCLGSEQQSLEAVRTRCVALCVLSCVASEQHPCALCPIPYALGPASLCLMPCPMPASLCPMPCALPPGLRCVNASKCLDHDKKAGRMMLCRPRTCPT